jgi:hypothetical protein
MAAGLPHVPANNFILPIDGVEQPHAALGLARTVGDATVPVASFERVSLTADSNPARD